MCHRRHKLATRQLNPIDRDQTGREAGSMGNDVSGLLIARFALERSRVRAFAFFRLVPSSPLLEYLAYLRFAGMQLVGGVRA